MIKLKTLRIQQCGLNSFPVACLYTMTDLQHLELEKNNLKSFCEDFEAARINTKSLLYLNLNGN